LLTNETIPLEDWTANSDLSNNGDGPPYEIDPPFPEPDPYYGI